MEETGYMAAVTVNRAGRIISADRKFCRMFSFANDSNPVWHYIADFIGGQAVWEKVRDGNATVEVRGRNRKGRTFGCRITPYPACIDGKPVYTCMVSRK